MAKTSIDLLSLLRKYIPFLQKKATRPAPLKIGRVGSVIKKRRKSRRRKSHRRVSKIKGKQKGKLKGKLKGKSRAAKAAVSPLVVLKKSPKVSTGKETAPLEISTEPPKGKMVRGFKKQRELPDVSLLERSKKVPDDSMELVGQDKDKEHVLVDKDAKQKETIKKETAEQKVEEAPAEVQVAAPKRQSRFHWKGLDEFLAAVKGFGHGKQRMAVIQNLATMLTAGLPIIDSLQTLQLETRSSFVKKLLGRVVENVENGSPLWRALNDEHFLSPHALALVRIGEEAGNLAQNMEYLSIQMEKDHTLRQKVTIAMIYPAIVLTLMFIIVMGLGIFVLPNLIQVLFSLNVPLPFVTRMVIKFTQFFTVYGKIGVPSIIVGFFLIGVLAKFSPLRVVAQWVTFHIPGIGRLAREATIARFGVILGGLLQAGVPLVESLQSLVLVTSTIGHKRFYNQLLEHISVGDSFHKSFTIIPHSDRYLPLSVQQLIMTGERSGTLSKLMLKVADIYEKKANETAQKLPIILEPMLLLFIGALVGTIALSIIVPIYSIVGNIH